MEKKSRVLIVDDSKPIHDDIKSILIDTEEKNEKVAELEKALFNIEEVDDEIKFDFNINDAFTGEEAVEMVKKSEDEGYPYELIFMDVRMEPGIDGVEALDRVWKINRDIKVIICTAYSDYSVSDIKAKIGSVEGLEFLPKPFTTEELVDLVSSVVEKG